MNLLGKSVSVVALLVGIIILLGVVFAGYYNSFVTKKNGIDGQWAQVETQYQRRVDLIPNLVEAAKGAQIQEQKVFGDIAQARQNYAGARGPEERVNAANELEGSLSRLLLIFENYPQLQSNQNILRLQDELAGTENRISVERGRYNEQVRDYNTSVQRFPGTVFARLMGFKERAYFEAAQGSENAPRVDFGGESSSPIPQPATAPAVPQT